MRPRTLRTLAAAAVLTLGVGAGLAAQSAEIQRIEDGIDVYRMISTSVDSKVPAYMMRNAQAVAIFPRVRRMGFVVGLQKGTGLMVSRGADGTWGNPLFLRLSGGSFGWQAGVQSVDLILFFQTRKSVESVLDGGLTLGVDASVAAGSTGRQAAANTDTDLQSEIYSYSRTRGFFAGLSLSGASLSVDYDATDAFYRRSDLRPKDILSGSLLAAPQAADALRRTLEEGVRALKD
jgi:lipid-binding SYLF domain-containing protein